MTTVGERYSQAQKMLVDMHFSQVLAPSVVRLLMACAVAAI
jgi:hypothetical protein